MFLSTKLQTTAWLTYFRTRKENSLLVAGFFMESDDQAMFFAAILEPSPLKNLNVVSS